MATMAAVGLFELAGRPGQFTGVLARILRLPRYIGDARRRAQRSRRYAQIVGIAARNGLGEQLGDRSGEQAVSNSTQRPRWHRLGRALRERSKRRGALS